MTIIQNTARWTATTGAATLLIAASAIPAQARPWPDAPQQTRIASAAPAGSVHCPLNRIGTQLVRCENLTGAGVAADSWVPVLGAAPR